MTEAEGVDYYFDINDMEHYNEIREQLLAETGKVCKINWCAGFNYFLQLKKRESDSERNRI